MLLVAGAADPFKQKLSSEPQGKSNFISSPLGRMNLNCVQLKMKSSIFL